MLYKVFLCKRHRYVASSRKCCLLEAFFIVCVFVFPLLYTWAPFVDAHYGRDGPYCWILNTSHAIGDPTAKLEEALLWIVPFAFTGVFSLVCIMVAAFRLLHLYCRNWLLVSKKKIVLKETGFLLAILITNIALVVSFTAILAIIDSRSHKADDLITIWSFNFHLKEL